MSTVSYTIKHVGIRTDGTEEARKTAAVLQTLFAPESPPETEIAVWPVHCSR